MIAKQTQSRSVFIGIVAAGLLVVALTSGCSEKKESKATPTGATSATGTGPAERRTTTGADPEKAPPYPGMYGAPNSSK